MGRDKVYSWRLSAELKNLLESSARREQLSIGAFLERIVLDWVKNGGSTESDDEAVRQRRLRVRAMNTFGRVRGGQENRSERVQDLVRRRLREKGQI